MKRAQTTVIDFLFAVMLITTAVVLVSLFGFRDSSAPQAYTDVQILADSIYAPYPQDWNASTVVMPGFVVDHRLNDTLFLRAQNLSGFAGLLGVRSEYFINTTLGSIGSFPQDDAQVISTVTRYAAYNGTITVVEVIAWTPKQ